MAAAIRSRAISPVEVVDAALQRAHDLNPLLNALIWIDDKAQQDARAAERRLGGRAPPPPLLGVPITVKDLVLTRRGRTTGGSRIYGAGLQSDHDAPVVRRLKRAGAIVIGKNNLHELALGVTNLNVHFGPARNPWDTDRIPGGSSGGSAAAVAAGIGCASVGSDTRGSIRIPAALCGVTGLKASYGLVSTQDVIPLSWSLDHVGPLMRSVADAALLLGAMAGGRGGRHEKAAHDTLAGVTIGICEYLVTDCDPEIERGVLAAIDHLRTLGAGVREVRLPELDGSHGSSARITISEAATYHERSLHEQPGGFGEAIRERLQTARNVSAVDLVKAQRHRVQVRDSLDRIFAEVDCIAGASVPAFPPTIGEDTITLRGRPTNLLAELPRLTSPANLSGHPSVSLPCGFGTGGLPIGLQLVASREETLFRIGMVYQAATDWHRRRPPMTPAGSRPGVPVE